MAWEITDPRVESNNVVFINGHVVKLPSKYLMFVDSAAFNLGQKLLLATSNSKCRDS